MIMANVFICLIEDDWMIMIVADDIEDVDGLWLNGQGSDISDAFNAADTWWIYNDGLIFDMRLTYRLLFDKTAHEPNVQIRNICLPEYVFWTIFTAKIFGLYHLIQNIKDYQSTHIAEMSWCFPISWKIYKLVHVLFCQIGNKMMNELRLWLIA